MNPLLHKRMRNQWATHGLLLAAMFLLSLPARAQSSDWKQWGGPNGNFKVEAKGLATSWPESGPRRLWNRDLGDGYSSISVENGVLYTMYRKGEQDVVIALSASTGKTIWEFAYDAPFVPAKEYDLAQGPGPRATPIIAGDLVFAVGATSKFHALDKKTGKVIWKYDLYADLQGYHRQRGYTITPVAYKNTVIVPLGAPGAAIIAFNQKDGAIVWKKHDFKLSYGSPTLIKLDGQDQLVAYMHEGPVGVDPNNGDLLWSYPFKNSESVNASTPVWGDDNLLFCSSAYDGGSLVLKLTRNGNQTTVEQVWANKLMRIHFGNAIRVGNYVYASSGEGPAPFTAIDVKTGQIAWRTRGLGRASVLLAEGRFILLDEDGNLALATPTPEGLKIHSKVESLLTSYAWTPPTLVGTTLYVRNRKTIMALDLK